MLTGSRIASNYQATTSIFLALYKTISLFQSSLPTLAQKWHQDILYYFFDLSPISKSALHKEELTTKNHQSVKLLCQKNQNSQLLADIEPQ